jgi:hypothetical protein
VRLPGRSLVALALLAGCSKLPTTGDGIVAIEIDTPATLTLYKDSSVTLHARALDQQGTEVTAVVRWFTVDTAAATVDSILGRVTAKASGGSARIQASVGTLHSSPLTLLLAPTPTSTLVLPREH